MIRLFDIIFSAIALLAFSPFLLIIALLITIDSKGSPLFFFNRVGKNGREFVLWKFRSMHSGSEKKGSLTIGSRDARVTPVGYFLRKYKLDELPQLINVLKGEMSLVGPRPEVKKYVDLYTPEQRIVLSVKPGITDYASIKYRHENEILAASKEPEKTYVEEILPNKIYLNTIYIKNQSLKQYFKIIGLTIVSIFSRLKPVKA